MKAYYIRTAVVLVLMLMGCSGQSKLWTSHPEREISGNPFYRAELTPLKETENYYVKFRLNLSNLTTEPLFIDWNHSYYILDNHISGPFLFNGITPEIAQSSTIPEDRIEPGGTLTREIIPLERLILTDGEMKKRPGIIPEGENGIYLTVHQNNRFVRGKIALQILNK